LEATVKFRACIFLLSAALVGSVAALGQSTDNDGCSNATLSGDYGFRITGQILAPDTPPVQREGIAMTHFDGAGKLAQVDFVMSNGTPVSGPADPLTRFHTRETGWYVVYPDCTGRAEIDFPAPPLASSGAVIDLMFVLSNHGRTMHAIVSRLLPPGSTVPVPVLIHSDAEKLGRISDSEQ
jgi:hypothetical protein